MTIVNHKTPLAERLIDERVIASAGDPDAWKTPRKIKRKQHKLTVQLSPLQLQFAEQLALNEGYESIEDWVVGLV